MKNKRYLLFDLDGTVADSAPGVMDSVEHSLKKMGITPPDRGFLAKFIGPPLRYSYMEYIGLSAEDAERGVALYREHYAVEGILNTGLFEGVKEFLEAAKEKGKTVLLATAKPEVFAKRCLKNLGVEQYFDYVSAASFTPELDSKSAIVGRALAMSGADKEDCVMIGDRCYDIEGAHNNGIPCIGVVNGSPFEKELIETGADAVVNDFFALRKFLL
ncbi:MAG: HAD hydrolase-like protein [Clostridia bacterium]|nr:HAD hydrolase-like protein [Clostridia bacterium]